MGIYLSSKLLRNEEYYEKTSELYLSLIHI